MCKQGRFLFFFLFLGISCEFFAMPSALGGESHPYQDQLACDRAPGTILKGILYNIAGGQRVRIAEYANAGHVGACEMALRAARRGRVCVSRNYRWHAIEIASGNSVREFGSDFEACLEYTKEWELDTRDGYVEWIDRREMEPFMANMPHVDDAEIDDVLHSTETMWYDEASMVFTYQDSFGNPEGPEGLRGNRVGYDVGSTSSVPDIRALTEYFEHGKFRFPFAIAAGSDFREEVYVLNYWSPPLVNGERLPVIWWKNGSHWHWVFPVGTVIGEVLLMRAPDDREWYVFEVRSRIRRLDGWTTNVFRPFVDAASMAEAIREARPQWNATDLRGLVTHLERRGTLEPATLQSEAYREVFEPIHGAYDYLPATTDAPLIKSFLRERTFTSAMGREWKRDGSIVTFAAATRAAFQIVPQGYIGGLLEASEEACSRCHSQTGRPLGQLDRRVVLYGEIWGEDEIFTWHPFAVGTDIFSVSDGSRRVNPRLVQAGLLERRQPRGGEQYYKELPKAYPTQY